MYMRKEYNKLTNFDWDDGNSGKNRKHGVNDWECEQVFFNEPLVILEDTKHSGSESRFAAFGCNDAGRRLEARFRQRRSIRIRCDKARAWRRPKNTLPA